MDLKTAFGCGIAIIVVTACGSTEGETDQAVAGPGGEDGGTPVAEGGTGAAANDSGSSDGRTGNDASDDGSGEVGGDADASDGAHDAGNEGGSDSRVDAGGCPAASDGCNRVVATIDGRPLVVRDACYLVGGFYQRAILSDSMFGAGCVPDQSDASNQHDLTLEFDTSGLFLGARSDGAVLDTTGSGTTDILEIGRRMRGTFDISFGDDRVCGCFDVTPE